MKAILALFQPTNGGVEYDKDVGGPGTTVIDRPAEVVNTPPEDEEQTKKPDMYAVLLLNDNSSAPQSVVDVLKDAFSVDEQRATQLMLQAHNDGRAVVTTTTKDLAEAQLAKAMDSVTRLGRNALRPNGACELRFITEPA